MRSQTVSVVSLALLLFGSTAATTAVEPAAVDARVPLGNSSVEVTMEEVAGLDWVTVTTATRSSSVDVTPGSPRTCVSAGTSEVRTESRGGGDVEVKVVRTESGCTATTDYTFDRIDWRAVATAVVPTTVATATYERGTDGWELVEDRSQAAVSTIELTWQGVGDEQAGPWVVPPSICYTNPPTVCNAEAGLEVTRDALVEGSIQLGGLAASTELTAPGAPGAMRWWLSAG